MLEAALRSRDAGPAAVHMAMPRAVKREPDQSSMSVTSPAKVIKQEPETETVVAAAVKTELSEAELEKLIV